MLIKYLLLFILISWLGAYIRLYLVVNYQKNGLLIANIIGVSLAAILISFPLISLALAGSMTSMSSLIKYSFNNLSYLIITITLCYCFFWLFI